jgi:lysophospholipase L1-like esterase
MRKNIFSTTLLGFLAAAIPAAAVDQNLVIVSIGDSLAAGEGNPNSFVNGHASWLSASCHQSVNNGRRFASNRITNLDGVSTQFFDFSCSGAKIDEGLLGTQLTSQPNVNNFLVPPQIDRVATLQHTTLGNRPIDILMISVGVNDVNFADVVTACLEPGDCTNSGAVNTARGVIASATLANAYVRLAAAIRQKLNVRRVYITEYPDEVTSAPNAFCGGALNAGDPTMVGVSPEESQFLLEHVIRPLNTKVQQAAQAAQAAPPVSGDISHPNWAFVHGPVDTFATHGFCTSLSRRYMNTLKDSMDRQGDVNGTMHPNVAGHQAYADALIRQATLDFNLQLETPRVVRTVESNVDPGFDLVPLADSGPKLVTVEIAQHPGILSVVVLHRVLNPTIPFFPPPQQPAFTSTTMADAGPGSLNLFAAQIPGFNPLLGQTMQYKVVITATHNGETAITTTGSRTIFVGEPLVQQ